MPCRLPLPRSSSSPRAALTLCIILACSMANATARDKESAGETVYTHDPVSAVDRSAARERIERQSAFNPYVITAHKANFVLPVSYTSSINDAVYVADEESVREGLRPEEVKFQVSLKTRLNQSDMLLARDGLFFGLTIEAWWQLYARDYSSPFRETNYQPEIFYVKPGIDGPFGGSTTLVLGLEHQSNGQVQGLSRSWNRLYVRFLYERDNFTMWLRPWYRLPEEPQRFPFDPRGDDNPDIEKFMGYQDFGVGWRRGKYEYMLATRFNPASGKGAIDIAVSYPLWGRFQGFIEYFNGYGDALIDYNHHQQRVGIGLALTSLF